MPCITLAFDPAIGPILNVVIASAGTLKSAAATSGSTPTAFPLLVDSGADITCISEHVVTALGLTASGKGDRITPAGPSTTNLYLVDIGVHFGVGTGPALIFALENVQVMQFEGTVTNYQGLLGRDIICQGQLTVTGYDKRFTFCL